MASDVRIWTGASWESIKGDKGDPGAPGPNVVSADAGNASRLGTDGRIFTPTVTLPAGPSIRKINQAAYTVVAGDIGNTLWNVYSAGNCFVNLPNDAEAAIPENSTVFLIADTATLTNIRPNTGASLFWQDAQIGSNPDNSAKFGGSGPSFVTRPLGRLSITRLVKVAANTWYHFPN